MNNEPTPAFLIAVTIGAYAFGCGMFGLVILILKALRTFHMTTRIRRSIELFAVITAFCVTAILSYSRPPTPAPSVTEVKDAPAAPVQSVTAVPRRSDPEPPIVTETQLECVPDKPLSVRQAQPEPAPQQPPAPQQLARPAQPVCQPVCQPQRTRCRHGIGGLFQWLNPFSAD